MHLLQLIQLGTYGVVDETMFAFSGHDMREAGHAMSMPRKPRSHIWPCSLGASVAEVRGSDLDRLRAAPAPAGGEALRLLVTRNFPGCFTFARSCTRGSDEIVHNFKGSYYELYMHDRQKKRAHRGGGTLKCQVGTVLVKIGNLASCGTLVEQNSLAIR